MRTLEDWRPGADVRNNARHQQSPEAIRELQRAVVRAGPVNQPGRGLESYLCRVVREGPESEADYAGPRYWLERLYVVGTAYRALPTFGRDRIDELTEFDGSTGEPAIVTGTNTAEVPDGTHLLFEGDYVWVWTEWDRADPSQQHYLFNRPPGGDTLLKITSIESGAGAIYGVVVVVPPEADIDVTVDPTITDLGDDGVEAYVIDINEVGRDESSHLLAVGSCHNGTILHVNTDGTRVYRIAAAPGPYERFEVAVNQVGGANGDNDNPPTYTYDVTAGNGEVLGAALIVDWAAPNGAVTAAVAGTCYYTSDGTLILAEVNEVPETDDECPPV